MPNGSLLFDPATSGRWRQFGFEFQYPLLEEALENILKE
ncbi:MULTISPECIES: DUF1731 domain-containing protein [unclassified Imperialibacter]|nr:MULTISPECIES: DUF1731 domain-containing protein [unclassified Imperialibacter]